MPAIDLGLNSASVSYEVALDVLGASRQPFTTALGQERAKAKPSQPFIRYCEARLAAIDELQDDLAPDDLDTIAQVLSLESDLFRRPAAAA